MAEAIVYSVLQTLAQPIIQEARGETKFLFGVSDKVEDAKLELEMMRCFLKDADARARCGDETLRDWVLRITDVAYDLENVVSTFVLKEEAAATKGMVLRIACLFKRPIELHEVGTKIDMLSNRVSKLTRGLQAYGVRVIRSNERQNDPRRTYSHVPEPHFVGFKEKIRELVAHLTNPASRVVSICGMGGSGKTTLAKEVYHQSEVKNQFNCFAWVYVSQQFQPREIWEGILFDLFSPAQKERKEIKDMSNDEVARKLHQVLQQKKSLVVLDDVWTKEAWNILKPAFPENTTQSKMLITTRKREVALHADSNGFICEPQHLNHQESWELLAKKASYLKNIEETKPSDYKEMKELGNKMLKHCGGLPLAVVVLGGLLSAKCTLDEWGTLHENVKEHINKGEESIGEQEYKGVFAVLGLSYDELPYQLKPCFLHLANFPEDYEINVKELCKLWTAEGFALNDNEAHKCLMALVHRNMVQVGNRSSIVGRIKTCRMHDLMRDLCLEKARSENFLSLINFQEAEGSSISTQVKPTSKVRRLAIHSNNNIVSQLLPSTNNRNGCLRSLICFGPKEDLRYPRDLFKPLFNCFYMLRVLKVESISTFGSMRMLPKEIGRLIHLRFLSLKNCLPEYRLPSSMVNLRCLQTLDLRRNAVVSIMVLRSMNIVISKLDHLRHLYLPKLWEGICLDKLSIQLGCIVKQFQLRLANLKSLETLVNFDTSYCKLDDLSQLTKLTKLGIITQNDGLGEIKLASNLQSLDLFQSDDGKLEDIVPFLSSYLQIQKLKLEAKLVRLQKNIPCPNLVKVTLRSTYLAVDPMPILGKLSKLQILTLGYRSYFGKKMVCCKDSFPQLESFSLQCLRDLEELRVEEGALPKLCHLKLIDCMELKSYPDGLRNITTLKEIEIIGMSEGFKRSFDQKEGDEGCPDEIKSAN